MAERSLMLTVARIATHKCLTAVAQKKSEPKHDRLQPQHLPPNKKDGKTCDRNPSQAPAVVPVMRENTVFFPHGHPRILDPEHLQAAKEAHLARVSWIPRTSAASVGLISIS